MFESDLNDCFRKEKREEREREREKMSAKLSKRAKERGKKEREEVRYSRKTENNARQLFGYIFTTCRLRAHQILNCQLDSPHTHRDRPTHWLTSTFGPFLCVRGSIQF